MSRRLLIATTVPWTLDAFMLPLARHLRAHGWQVDAMAAGAPANGHLLDSFDHVWDAPWSRSVLDPRNLLRAPAAVRRIVAREKYDIVHVHTPVAAFVTRFALRKARHREGGPQVIYTAHGFHFHAQAPRWQYYLFLALEKIAARWMDYLVLVNSEDAEAALRHGLAREDRLTQTRGVGIDLTRFAPDRIEPGAGSRLRSELRIPEGEPILVTVAEFIPRKRHEDVVRAFARIRSGAHLVLAGEGPLLEPMRRLARKIGVEDRVHFLGYRRDVPALIHSSTALVLASTQEGLPTCVLEAQCLGTPVIGSDIRGTRDLLQDGCGLLVPLGDVDRLAEAMEWVLTHPAEAAHMAESARTTAKGHDVDAVNTVYENLYMKALEERPWPQLYYD